METRVMFFIVMLLCLWLVVSTNGRKIINKTAELIVGEFSITGKLPANTSIAKNTPFEFQITDKSGKTDYGIKALDGSQYLPDSVNNILDTIEKYSDKLRDYTTAIFPWNDNFILYKKEKK
jgi:hypothetical protein